MQAWSAWVLGLMVAVVAVGCVPRTQGFEVSEYQGVTQGTDGRVWITGTTTTYGPDLQGQLIITKARNWIKVCTETRPSVLACRAVAVSDVTDAPRSEPFPVSSPPKGENEDEGDDEGAFEDKR